MCLVRGNMAYEEMSEHGILTIDTRTARSTPIPWVHLFLSYKLPSLPIWGDARLYRWLVHTPGPLRASTVEEMQSCVSRLTFVFTSIEPLLLPSLPSCARMLSSLGNQRVEGETTAQPKEGAV